MVARIVAGDEKSERPLSSSSSTTAAQAASDRLMVAWGRLTDDLLGQTELGRRRGFLWPRDGVITSIGRHCHRFSSSTVHSILCAWELNEKLKKPKSCS
ncbi:hypothetical protein PanWU01x14_215960 [Parasponia andersonii]|uniref:Uncharacterized protein n=1 Tax=Parasponia andersonii TaxID=3476 RepID=A0A2P5BRZ4_PARAD|nr:hypothetical protein PanWU01x14_215960 [Parasponia andersonii]